MEAEVPVVEHARVAFAPCARKQPALAEGAEGLAFEDGAIAGEDGGGVDPVVGDVEAGGGGGGRGGSYEFRGGS